jgi:hypothetical protein
MSYAVASIDENNALGHAPIVIAPFAGGDSNRNDNSEAEDG